IDGNLQVGTGATLVTQVDPVPPNVFELTVHGNVAANGCVFAALQHVVVDGNVSIQNCTSTNTAANNALPNGSQVAGNFNCSNNPFCLFVRGTVNGNVQINNNGNALVVDNIIGNNLQCKGNTSISGSGNTVGGKNQCAGL